MAEVLLLGFRDPENPEHILDKGFRVTVPEGLTREDLYWQILAEIPADEPQPVALNLESESVAVPSR